MPPRSLKSQLVSVAFVAWLLGHDPTLRIICVSYGAELSEKLASDCRTIILSAWFQRMFPRCRLAPKRQSLGNFETTAGGGRFSTSVGGVLTGFGADYIIVDDPSKPSESLSDVERSSINDWIQHTLFILVAPVHRPALARNPLVSGSEMRDRSVSAHILLAVLEPVFVNEIGPALPLRPDEPNDFGKRKPALFPAEFRQLPGSRFFEHWEERHTNAKSFFATSI
jgi:hypothetical protein